MLRQVLRDGKNYLKQNMYEKNENINYGLDAELLLMDILGLERIELVTKDNIGVSESDKQKYISLLEKRAKGMPIQYILGKCEFMSLPFHIDKNVLIPRADTEITVEKIIDYAKDKDRLELIEIGTGSGCISISLAKYCDNVHITAIDISHEALEIAKNNAKINGVWDKIDFVHGDMFATDDNIDSLIGKVDIVVSNPPYIKTEDILGLGVNVRDYEPHLALDGKEDGLYFYDNITRDARKYLRDNGLLIYEIGYDQKNDVAKIMDMNNFENITCLKDLAGHDRVIFSFKK